MTRRHKQLKHYCLFDIGVVLQGGRSEQGDPRVGRQEEAVASTCQQGGQPTLPGGQPHG